MRQGREGSGKTPQPAHIWNHIFVFSPVTSLLITIKLPEKKNPRHRHPLHKHPFFPSVCYLVCLETWITQSSMQGRRGQKCMNWNPMSYSRNSIRHQASSARLSTVHGELMKVSQAVTGTGIRRERISFHRDRHVKNSFNRVTPDLIRDCQKKITRPTGTPGWVTVEEMIDSRTVGDHKIRSNRCRHFKTFQRVVSLDPLILPPPKNHGIEVKLQRKTSELLFRRSTQVIPLLLLGFIFQGSRWRANAR